MLKDLYRIWYFPIALVVVVLGVLGLLPRAGVSTRGEGRERRYFYSGVWAVAFAQPTLWALWKWLPQTRAADLLKLVVFVGVLTGVAGLAYFGRLPRTRLIVADTDSRIA
jgi:hypothetical protein